MKNLIIASSASLCLAGFVLPFLISEPAAKSEEVTSAEAKPDPFHKQVEPLANLIASGEGSWDSVNRGRAGDTPGGIKRLTGKSFKEMTIAQVIDLQRTRIFAVGRYQMLPGTLKLAVRKSGIKKSELFTNENQNILFATLLEHKRPRIAAYLKGFDVDLGKALDDLAMEWACVGWRDGYSYYSQGGNRASISRYKAGQVLKAIRYTNVSN